jgi:hypothetical protein
VQPDPGVQSLPQPSLAPQVKALQGGLHVVQVPLRQIWSTPQLAPSPTFAPVSVQTEVPVAQEVLPT